MRTLFLLPAFESFYFLREEDQLLLLLLLIVLLMGVLPAWPHSRNWGYYPSGGIGLVVLVVIILLVMGRI